MEEYTIQELRIKEGFTQKKVAEKTGLTKDYISLIERGRRVPSDKTKHKLAKVYKVPEVQIFLAIQRTNSTLKQESNKIIKNK